MTNAPCGWIYLNPDTGIEITNDHPIESGECLDAENPQPFTAEIAKTHLIDAWNDIKSAEQAVHAAIERCRQLDTALKSMCALYVNKNGNDSDLLAALTQCVAVLSNHERPKLEKPILTGPLFSTPVDEDEWIIARFVPQAWQNDNAVEVDPEGPASFDVTAEILALGKKKALELCDSRDETDTLKSAANAPEWIKNWTGPFYICVEDAIRDYFSS